MTMTPESPLQPAAIAEWILAIATRLLARSLNMPEPLVVSTGAYVFAQVAAAETRAAKSLCPFALARAGCVPGSTISPPELPSFHPPRAKGELP
jgi:hypothetical protein